MAGPALAFQTGDHSSRPAASAGCVLYSCTDHNLVYRSDGSSWTTLITLASGIADTTFNAKGDILSASADDTPAILTVGSNGSLLRAASGQSTGLEWQKNNLAATAAPGTSDDGTAGYSVGSAWFDTTNDEVYFAIDVSTGAAVWKQVGSGSGGGGEESYTQITSNVTVTGTAEGSETTVITGASFTADGTSSYMVDFMSPRVDHMAAATGRAIVYMLYEQSTIVGRIGVQIAETTNTYATMMRLGTRVTPSAGTRQYIVKAWKTNAGDSAIIGAGAGGSGTNVPAYLRVVKA